MRSLAGVLDQVGQLDHHMVAMFVAPVVLCRSAPLSLVIRDSDVLHELRLDCDARLVNCSPLLRF
jgi:hypothetical protein